MTKKIVLGVMAAALVAVVASPSATASCIPAKTATTFGNGTAYWLPVTSAGTPNVQAWQLGATGTFLGTGCPDSFLFEDAGGAFSLAYDLGACGAGCPAGLSTLAVLAQNRSATGGEFLLATIAETPGDPSGNWQFATQGDHQMIPIPRPRVTSSTRNGINVDLTITIDSIAAGLFGPNAGNAVTGYRILGAVAAADPGSAAGAYESIARAVVPGAGGAAVAGIPLSVSCADPTKDQYLSVQLSFENGAVLSGTTSAATRVRCIPALADPKPKVKIAPKKGIATN